MGKSKRKRLTASDNGGDKVDALELAELLCDTTIFPNYPFRQGQKDARWRINIFSLPNELLDEYKRLFKLILLLRQRALTSQECKEFNQLAILLEQRILLPKEELDLIMQTVGSYEMSKIGKFLQQRCNVTKSELNDLNWTDILEHLTLQADLASEPKTNANSVNAKDIEPIKVEKLWRCKSFKLLREIDCDEKREGIRGDKKTLKMLRDWLKRHRKRPDIARTLELKDGRINTTLPYRSIFSE